jgi:hypothetical protein
MGTFLVSGTSRIAKMMASRAMPPKKKKTLFFRVVGCRGVF